MTRCSPYGRLKPLWDYLQRWDYQLLPVAARLPLGLANRYSALRGELNAALYRDWRSSALGTEHIRQQTRIAWQSVYPESSEQEIDALVKERFRTESREEFEACLFGQGAVEDLSTRIEPQRFAQDCLTGERGLVLLTPHFDSYAMGVVLLGQAGLKVNLMVSSVYENEQVCVSVRRLFNRKYRGMERYLNGGKVLFKEDGLRPFYEILKRGECLVILADAPAISGVAGCSVEFLGARRNLAAGGLRLAEKTDSRLGGFFCRYEGNGSYVLHGGPLFPEAELSAFESIYEFFSAAILAEPGRWWAADLLPAMAVTEAES